MIQPAELKGQLDILKDHHHQKTQVNNTKIACLPSAGISDRAEAGGLEHDAALQRSCRQATTFSRCLNRQAPFRSQAQLHTLLFFITAEIQL